MSHAVLLATALSIALLPGIGFAQSGALPLFGRKLLVRNAVPENESRNKVILVARDGIITIPAPGTAGDPRCPLGDPGRVIVIGVYHDEYLLCGNWTLVGDETSPRAYRYDDPELDDGTVRTIIWKPGMLKILMKGSGPTTLHTDLTPGNGTPYVEVTLHKYLDFGAGYCVYCHPVDGRDGSDGRTFLGRNCPPQSFCISSVSGAFLD